MKALFDLHSVAQFYQQAVTQVIILLEVQYSKSYTVVYGTVHPLLRKSKPAQCPPTDLAFSRFLLQQGWPSHPSYVD